MTVIYQTTITRIGASATDALSDQMLITFREGALRWFKRSGSSGHCPCGRPCPRRYRAGIGFEV